MRPEDIKELRAALGLTQSELAARLGVNLRTVQHWEQPEGQDGHRKPRGPALLMLASLAATHAARLRAGGK